MAKLHFVGIGGNGMSALAQLHAMSGDTVSGSDRLIDKGYRSLPLWESLAALKITLTPQDGSGITADLDAVVFSSAIENDNPDSLKTKRLGLPVIHRSELLAKHVAQFKTVAVSGTSGKSTTTAMVYEILESAGMSPSVITGAGILSLQQKGFIGNVYRGKSNLLVIEADESDGSIVNYRPLLGIMLNLTKDHKELETLREYFRKFKQNCAKFLINADDEALAEFAAGSGSFGVNSGKTRAENVKLDGYSSSFTVNGAQFNLPVPGAHNVQNAMAAVAAALELGVSAADCAKALAGFKGVARRFNSLGSHNNIEVIDDFAHNPAKIEAAIAAAKLRAKRVLAIYQPHGYAPVKLLFSELVDSFAASLGPSDILWLPEIYYIGGTADKNISSADIARAVKAKGRNAVFTPCREEIIPQIINAAAPGDVILLMGARDPTLTQYAKSILKALKDGAAKTGCGGCLLNVRTPSGY